MEKENKTSGVVDDHEVFMNIHGEIKWVDSKTYIKEQGCIVIEEAERDCPECGMKNE